MKYPDLKFWNFPTIPLTSNSLCKKFVNRSFPKQKNSIHFPCKSNRLFSKSFECFLTKPDINRNHSNRNSVIWVGVMGVFSRKEDGCLVDIMQLSTMQKLAIQMFVQDFSKLERKSRHPTHFMLQSSNEWERFNELCLLMKETLL